jgi:hypothetical protein
VSKYAPVRGVLLDHGVRDAARHLQSRRGALAALDFVRTPLGGEVIDGKLNIDTGGCGGQHAFTHGQRRAYGENQRNGEGGERLHR